MNYPGENKLTLTREAIELLIVKALNRGQHEKAPRIRIVRATRLHFMDNIELTITTDPIPETIPETTSITIPETN